MAKLKYNSRLVQNTIDELGVASNQLVNTEDDIRSALQIIANARGVHHVATDKLFSTLGFPAACQEMIEETIDKIKKTASELEAYNKEYEDASFLEKLGSTAGLFVTKLCEGFASGGEQLIDGFASVIGWGVGLFSKSAQDSIANFIKKDHVGEFFGNLYDTSLKGMVIRSWASEKGLACNIFKGIGTGISYALALAATGYVAGGLSTGTTLGAKTYAATLMSSLPAAAATAGIGGLGAGTQAGLKGGWDYSDALMYGIKYGAIQAGTTVVFSLAFKGLSKGWKMLKSKMKGNATSTDLMVINNNGTGGTGNTTGGTTPGGTPKSGVTFKGYTAGNGKTYTSLDDVWADVLSKDLSKKQVVDILKNTVGLDDGGIGHSFLSDATEFLRGKGNVATPRWIDQATKTAADAVDNTMINVGSVDDAISTISTAADDTIGTINNHTPSATDLAAINNSMDEIGGNLIKTQDALTSAQQALDDAIAAGADDATLSPLRQAVDNAKSAYNQQYQNLLTKQQQYRDLTAGGSFDGIGTEGSYKLIIGDDIAADSASVAGDITTLRAGTTKANGMVEYRPNWTNSTATTEGQIDVDEFAKLLDDQYGPVIPTQNPSTALATVGPTDIITLPPKGSTDVITLPPKGPTDIITIPPKGPTDIITIPPKGPTDIITLPPTPPVVIEPKPPIPAKDAVIFGVVQPEEIVTTPPITITPVDVIPVTTPPITTPPVIITEGPIIITTTPPVITTAPPVITTAPPVITTAPPVIITEPPVITTQPIIITTPPIVTTPPPSTDLEYVPIPNTGIGQNKSRGVGVAPIVAGAVAGIAGAVGGSLLNRKKENNDDSDEEELESEE